MASCSLALQPGHSCSHASWVTPSMFSFFFFCLILWHAGCLFPDWGLNACPLKWKDGVLTIGLPGKSVSMFFQIAACVRSCLIISDSATPWTVARQAPLSMGFSRQEYWSGLPRPPPGQLHDPEIEPESLLSPALAGGFFITGATWEALKLLSFPICKK